jgi:RNA polymerase sigma-70 factor (ECF subfamily)
MQQRVADVATDAWPTYGQADLIRRAARGDSRAFEMLVSTRAEPAFRIARAILGNESDARDATQDAFMSVWRELPRLRDPDRFDAWLRRILVNACRGQIRARGRVREIPLEAAPDRAPAGPGMSEQVSGAEVLDKAFGRLDADKRAILVLHYLEHESVASIARAIGVPVGTMKWRLHSARAALERALRAEGEDRR